MSKVLNQTASSKKQSIYSGPTAHQLSDIDLRSSPIPAMASEESATLAMDKKPIEGPACEIPRKTIGTEYTYKEITRPAGAADAPASAEQTAPSLSTSAAQDSQASQVHGQRAKSAAKNTAQEVGSKAVDDSTAGVKNTASAGVDAAKQASDAAQYQASKGIDTAKQAGTKLSEKGEQAADWGQEQVLKGAETAKQAGNVAVEQGQKTGAWAQDQASKSIDTASDAARKAGQVAADTTSWASDQASKAADGAKQAGESAAESASSWAAWGGDQATKGLDTAKQTAEETGRRAGSWFGWGANQAKQASAAGYDAAKSAGNAAVETGEQALEWGQEAAAQGYETAKNAGELAGEAGERAASWANWGQHQASQAIGSTYDNVLQPVMHFLWWLYVTLPYEAATWAGHAAWTSGSWVWNSAEEVSSQVSVRSSKFINSFADIAFRVVLGSLRTLNRHMDQLVNNTPNLIRNTLQAARAAKEGRGATPTVEGFQTEAVDELDMAQEVDVARAANDTLHRVFDTHVDATEGDQQRDGRSTLLSEARKLAWHSWMLVALQVTAVRTMLRVMEGTLGWVASAWLRLGTAALVLTGMAALAPLAAVFAALAWTCRAVLSQIIALHGFGQSMLSFMGPPIHNGMIAVRNLLRPHLEVTEVPARVETTEEAEGPRAQLQEQEEEGEQLSGEHEHVQQGMLSGVIPTDFNAIKSTVSNWLDTGVEMTSHLLPQEKAVREPQQQGSEEDTSSRSSDSSSSVSSAMEALQVIADDAELAWKKTSALATATLYTVLDIARVVLLGLATRFDINIPHWVPGLNPTTDDTAALAREPSVEQFNETAGKGPASGKQAIGAMVQQQQQDQPRGKTQHIREERGQAEEPAAATA